MFKRLMWTRLVLEVHLNPWRYIYMWFKIPKKIYYQQSCLIGPAASAVFEENHAPCAPALPWWCWVLGAEVATGTGGPVLRFRKTKLF